MQKMPQSILKIFAILFLGIYSFSLLNYPVYSDEISDLENQIEETNEQIAAKKSVLSQIEKKIAEISGSNYSLSQKIEMINEEIDKLEKDIGNTDTEINKKIKEIEEKQTELEKKKTLLDEISSDLYMESRYRVSSFFLSTDWWDNMMENLFVKKNTISILKDEIEKVNGEFSNLTETKAGLDKQKEELDTQKKDLDKSYGLLAAEKAKLQKELNAQVATKSSVSSQVSKLTSQLSNLQKVLLYARQGGTSIDPSLVPAGGNDLGSLATFNSKAPSGSFDVFSIGAYTHRNGMSQWGARARADAGQTYTKILNAYYPGKTFSTGKVKVDGTKESIMSKIKVDGYGTIDFEKTYLMGIKEMPESWPMEVLKAQAIAARTYAVRYTNNGRKSICTTESCQVFSTPIKTGAWKQAVEATRGIILTDSSLVPVSTQFAAVHGGWTNGVGWDLFDSSKVKDFTNTWDNRSGVSWVYRSWYRSDYKLSTTVNSDSCYRYPWLSGEELADIVNAASRLTDLGESGITTDSRIYPIPDRCNSSGNPYSFSEMRSKSSSKFTKVILVQTYRSSGSTTSIKFVNADGRDITISGSYFKLAYNLRAPGYLRIPQSSFVHIDIQKKL
ncbi:MAG: SpoIID/LytB domain-containing protein [Candidatus Dojkabacteria bacterium]